MIRRNEIVDYETFAFPDGYRGFRIFEASLVGLVGLGQIALLFYVPRTWPIALPVIAFFGWILRFAIDAARRSKDEIQTRREGLEYRPHQALSQLLLWDEISNLKEHPYLQHLVAMDRSGTRKIKLEYQLENFDSLREIILEKAQNRTNSVQIPFVFHRTRHFLIFFLVGCLFCLAMARLSYTKGGMITTLFFLGFAGFSLLPLFIEPVIIRVLNNRIILQFILWQYSIGFDEISKLNLQNVSGRHGSRIPTVIIERRQGKPFKLNNIREGSIALYEAVLSALKKARKP